MAIQTRNQEGNWVPAIPEPLYNFLTKECTTCEERRRFYTLEGYRAHYALVHILKLD